VAQGGAAAIELWHWESEIAIKEVLYPEGSRAFYRKRTRGNVQYIKKRRAPIQPRLGRAGGERGNLSVDTIQGRQRLKQIRRLDDLAAQVERHGRGGTWAEAQGLALWRSILHAVGFDGKFAAFIGDLGIFRDDCIPLPDEIHLIRTAAKKFDTSEWSKKEAARKQRGKDAVIGAWVHNKDDKWRSL
jgi:hypothetical protein